jgi:hypothetical protein
MIERRFIAASGISQFPLHLMQALLTLRSLNSMTAGQALTEANTYLSTTPLVANEQTDLGAISTWVNGGALSIDKITRWFNLEAVLSCAIHGGPLYGTEALLKAKLEALIGGPLT